MINAVTTVIGATIIIGIAITRLVALWALSWRRWRRSLISFRLRFPRDLSSDNVVAAAIGISGLAATWWRRPFSARVVVFEISADSTGIVHRVLVGHDWAPTVLAQLRAGLPNVNVTADEISSVPTARLAAEFGLAGRQRPLRFDDPAAVARSILAGLQPLAPDERIVVQWLVQPVGPVSPIAATPRRVRTGNGAVDALVNNVRAELGNGDALKAARAKRALPLFNAVGRVGVTSKSAARSRQLLRLALAPFHSVNAPGAHLYRRRLPSPLVASRLRSRQTPLTAWPCLLNANELVALLAFPLESPRLAGIELDAGPLLMPSSEIPSTGRVLARANFPGVDRSMAISLVDSLAHLHVVGPTGVGKSTLLLNLITQDMASRHAVIVVDPKGDLIADVLDRVPEHRIDDVVLLDPADDERPVGLNLLAGAADAPELVVDQVVGIIHHLYRSFWGPRTDDILRAALLTLVHEPGATLCEVPLLLTEPGMRRRLISRVDDPVALEPFWGWYEGMSAAERAQAIGPVMNKLRAFLLRRRVRNILGQSESALNLGEAIRQRRIVLVSLAKGLLGEEAAALLGALFVAQLWQTVQRRAAIAPDDREPIFAHIDEFQDFLGLPTSIGDLLVQARALGFGLTLAHQHLGQLPSLLRVAVMANARSRVIFQTTADDARVLAHELAPYVDAAQLRGLGRREVVVSVVNDGRVAAPATGVTLPPPESLGTATRARARSRERFGRDRAEVEAAIRARHVGMPGDGPVGRTRRSR